jgi:lysophospholipase L1-like esterase
MKPFRILLFFLSVFLVLFAVALYFPTTGIKLPGHVKLKFYTANDIFAVGDSATIDIQALIKEQELLNDSVISIIAGDSNVSIISDTLLINADSLKKSITRIEYPNKDSSILFPFFQTLTDLSQSRQLIRIMHYGDSQIEDDRMTSLLRNRLQSKFGGSGVGLVPASQLYPYSYSMVQESSENLYRYLVYGSNDSALNHKRFGALATFCTIQQVVPGNDTASQTAWVKFSKSPYAYDNTRYFRQCRIFYGHNHSPFVNEVYKDNQLFDAEIFPATNRMKVIRWVFDDPVSKLMVQFRCKESPEIYGIALDNTHGVAVDNVPLRGCAGLIFTSIDQQLLSDMYRALNVKLFILQFGGNVVPYIAENYRYYEKWFYSQIVRLKELCPGAAVLVIGVADMSIKDREKYVSYPNLENVKTAVKNAAFRGGAAYWDMHKAMGGENSMPAWVNANPPLASKDYIHFNPRGAQIVAQMFYNALIYDYMRYEKTYNALTTK